MNGGDWGLIVPQFGKIIWPIEEATFLNLVCAKDRFYAEISQFLLALISWHGGTLEDDQLRGLLTYQKNMIIDPFILPALTIDLDYDFHEYFDAAHLGSPRELQKIATRLAENTVDHLAILQSLPVLARVDLLIFSGRH